MQISSATTVPVTSSLPSSPQSIDSDTVNQQTENSDPAQAVREMFTQSRQEALRYLTTPAGTGELPESITSFPAQRNFSSRLQELVIRGQNQLVQNYRSFREAEIRDAAQVDRLLASMENLKDKDIPTKVLGPIMRLSEESYSRYLDLGAALNEQNSNPAVGNAFIADSKELQEEMERISREEEQRHDQEVEVYNRAKVAYDRAMEEYRRAASSESSTVRPTAQPPARPAIQHPKWPSRRPLSENPDWKRNMQKLTRRSQDLMTLSQYNFAAKSRILEWFNDRVRRWNNVFGYQQLRPFVGDFIKGAAGGVFQGDAFKPANATEQTGQAIGQIALGFTPAGPVADARDLGAAIQEVQQQGFNWGSVKGIVFAIAGFVPLGGDAAKAIKRAAASRRASAEANEGVIREVAEAMSRRAAEYQTKITGMPANHVHELNGVKFDGFKDGVLLEAKRLGYANFVKNGEFADWFKETGLKSLLQQADRQQRAAQGKRIQWHFSEEEPARLIKKMFNDKDINIEVIVTP